MAARVLGSFLLCASLAPRLVAGAVVRANSCPLANCQNRDNADTSGVSLLERSSATTKAGCAQQTFTPAHFTCSSCDVQTCKGCNNVICDVTKCIGKFYTQECWCTKPLNPATDKIFCDSDCTGGLCDTKGYTCKTRETSCKPWWWCKLPPPKEAEDSFLQKMSNRHGACARKQSKRSQSLLNDKFQQAKAHAKASSAQTSQVAKKQISAMNFQPGSFVCESALIPAPDEDPVTLAQTPAGFIVMDGNTCSGGFFKEKCFCYDKFLYLRGKDPKTSELQCDAGCGQGDCAGKTCGKEPPPPLPAPKPPPPVDPYLQELANEGMLRNYGTQMSPVT